MSEEAKNASKADATGSARVEAGVRLWEVWREGYCVTGNEATAEKVGEATAGTFAEACAKLYEGVSTFDPIRLMDWGCGLFDNETDARKNFG